MPDSFNYYHVLLSFSGTCTLPPVKAMLDDIDEKMGKKLKW
jgi:hypothetical protein